MSGNNEGQNGTSNADGSGDDGEEEDELESDDLHFLENLCEDFEEWYDGEASMLPPHGISQLRETVRRYMTDPSVSIDSWTDARLGREFAEFLEDFPFMSCRLKAHRSIYCPNRGPDRNVAKTAPEHQKEEDGAGLTESRSSCDCIPNLK